MVTERMGEENKSIGVECALRMDFNVDIVEEVYCSKIRQRLAYPDSIFSCYQSEWKDLTNGCLSRAECMQQARGGLETRSVASKYQRGSQREAQGSGYDFPWGLTYRDLTKGGKNTPFFVATQARCCVARIANSRCLQLEVSRQGP